MQPELSKRDASENSLQNYSLDALKTIVLAEKRKK
jgi:hypothetical protein